MANEFFSDETVSEVRERANILEVVSDYVSIKKTGRNHKGLCPFHSEKTPSFMVNEEKQIFHCFGCGEGGDVFTFLMKMGHFSFPEAVETLAKRYGVRLSPGRSPRRRRRRWPGERFSSRSTRLPRTIFTTFCSGAKKVRRGETILLKEA